MNPLFEAMIRRAASTQPSEPMPDITVPEKTLWTLMGALNHAYARIDDLSEDGISDNDKQALRPALAALQALLWKDTEDDSRPG